MFFSVRFTVSPLLKDPDNLNPSHQNSAGYRLGGNTDFCPAVYLHRLFGSGKSSNGWPSLLHLLWLCGHSCFLNLRQLNLSLAWPHAGNQSSLWPTVSLFSFLPLPFSSSSEQKEQSWMWPFRPSVPSIILHLPASFLYIFKETKYQFFSVAPVHLPWVCAIQNWIENAL